MNRTSQEKIRSTVLIVITALFALVALTRLVHLQVVNASKYGKIVERQSSGRTPIPAARGTIYDRYGRLLARDVIGSALCVYPRNKEELRVASRYLEKFYNLASGTAKKKYGLSVGKFRYITRRLSDKMAKRIEADSPVGLVIRQASKREYPFGLTGKQILGFTDIDNKGQSGFELSHNSMLAGVNGWADYRRDGLQNAFRIHEAAVVKPQRGASVVLSADWRLQGIVEEELEAAVEKYNAKHGMAAFVDVRTGDILALAHFDPNEKNRHRPIKNCAVTNQFEPGSSLKAFTAAGMLDVGLINFQDTTYCEEGVWKIGRARLHDDKKRGWLTFREIMELSSNIGIGKKAIEFGGEALFETLENFGFGTKTGCGLPGEASGMLRRLRWSDYNVAALSMGHSIAVTSVQMAMAMAVVANGGDLFKPNIILGMVDENGFVQEQREPELVRQVVDRSSLDSLHAFLRGVVTVGTATPVNSPSIAIAGKTGTAEIPDIKNKRYFKNRFNASFVGFFPANDPIIAGFIVIKNPRPITYGGYTSGVAFRRIAERYAVSNPDMISSSAQTLIAGSDINDNSIEVPDFTGRDIETAKIIAEREGINLYCISANGTIEWQFPKSDHLMMKGDRVIATTEPKESGEMLDLKGLTLRQASAFLHHKKISFTIKGNGRVVRQTLLPGTKIEEGLICRLECRPGRG